MQSAGLSPTCQRLGFSSPQRSQLVPVGQLVLRQPALLLPVLLLLPLCVLGADQLFAALSWYLDPLGPGTAQFGEHELMRAEGDAANCPIHAGALVFAVGTEDLPVLVNLVVVLAGSSI